MKIAVMALAAIAICSCKSKVITYEATSFDGSSIIINKSNISYQKHEDNVLETTKVPEGVGTAAPGRDFVYLENDSYYFVEDATRDLLTIARKEENTESAFVGDNFMLSYRKGSFTKSNEGDALNLSYTKEGLQAPGYNNVSFQLVKGTDCESLLLAKIKEKGVDPERLMITELYGVPGLTFVYVFDNNEEESEVKDFEYLYTLPCGEDVVYIVVNRTVSDDYEIDMPIEADFENLFLSYIVLI